MSSDKAKGKEIVDRTESHLSEVESDEGSEDEQPTSTTTAAAGSSSSTSKKKKKKRSKLAKLLKPGSSTGASDALVETVLEKVKAEHTDVDADVVRSALQQLNLTDVVAGKAGLGGKNKKETGDHKVRSSFARDFEMELNSLCSFGLRNLLSNLVCDDRL